ncbi:hypothetical protein DVH24_017049 [Malus domestica]|uniref:Gnk2-homologous domain-containing protein n=1 Tax=Malus domestica TaxID=3750 RepID=A0A498IRM3_MALDO|nr:hypothetical protein DVH24_017049 [Malus domestica]
MQTRGRPCHRLFICLKSETISLSRPEKPGFFTGRYVDNRSPLSKWVLFLEITMGRKNFLGFHLTNGTPTLIGYAWKLRNAGKVLELMDPLLKGSCSQNEFLRYVHIGLFFLYIPTESQAATPALFLLILNIKTYDFMINHQNMKNMTTLVLIFSIFTLPSFLTSTEAVFLLSVCPNTTTFTPNSTFQSNLNRLLFNLSSNANRSSTGFYNVTVQTTNNAVYGLFLCRGDVVGTDVCKICVANATALARQRCPVEKQVVIWYDDCMLRYSNESFFSTVTDSPSFYMQNTVNATDPIQFNQVVAASVNQAASEAVGDADKFGTNRANVNGLISVYSLAQCTQDLSAADCNRCLQGTIDELPNYCYGRIGGRFVYPSCNVRYEVYPFYAQNATGIWCCAVAADFTHFSIFFVYFAGKSKTPTSTIVAIAVPISVSVLLFVVGYCCITRRAKYKYNEAAADEPSGENDITTVESLQFDFATIQAATSNFSDDHKLGEGGFGQVYKNSAQSISKSSPSVYEGSITETENQATTPALLLLILNTKTYDFKINHKKIKNMTTLLLIISVFTQLSFSISSEADYMAHFCPNTTTFTPNSTFQSNLNRLPSTLSSNANRSTGFYNATIQTANNAAIDNFNQANIIVGGFGLVYRATLANGTKLAVKKLSRDLGLVKREFKTEVEALSIAQHENLVSMPTYLFLSRTSEAAPANGYSICDNTTTFTQNSTYHSNLNLLLSSLTSNATIDAGYYYTTTSSQDSNSAVYGAFLCRGDLTSGTCQDCVTTAAREAVQKYCPFRKVTLLWYDECMLRYGNVSFFRKMNESPSAYFQNPNNATEPNRFNQLVAETVTGLVPVAANAQTGAKKLAMKQENFDGVEQLYSLVQCTPDLSSTDCDQCLRGAIELIPECCDGRKGGRVLFPSCNIRYESFPFYNLDTSTPPTTPPPLPPPPQLPGSVPRSQGNDEQISSWIIVAIVVSIAILLSLVGCIFFRRRAMKKYNVIQEQNVGKEINAVESLQFSFGTIEAATNKFSVHNKLGKGGFEYAMHGQFSVKSDVYSLGVLILEIVIGKKNTNFYNSDNGEDLLSHAWRHWRGGMPLELLDVNLRDSYSRSEEDPDKRPKMQKIVLMLSSYSLSMPSPERPAFFMPSRTDPNMPSMTCSSSDQPASNSLSLSVNEASITELYPR